MPCYPKDEAAYEQSHHHGRVDGGHPLVPVLAVHVVLREDGGVHLEGLEGVLHVPSALQDCRIVEAAAPLRRRVRRGLIEPAGLEFGTNCVKAKGSTGNTSEKFYAAGRWFI